MDERQRQVRGKIFMEVSIGSMIMMLILSFLLDFEIINMDKYMNTSELLIGMSMLMMAYVSCSMILRDAYFGVVEGQQFKRCLYIFTALALILDGFAIFEGIAGEGSSFVSITTLLMSNSIMISLWCKRNSW